MSGLPVEYEYQHDPSGDVTDNDRDKLSARLNDAFAAGDLTIDDYQGRLQTVFDATKRAELVTILDGLPGKYRSNEPALAVDDQASRPGELAPLNRAPTKLVRIAAGAGIVFAVLVVLLVVLLM